MAPRPKVLSACACFVYTPFSSRGRPPDPPKFTLVTGCWHFCSHSLHDPPHLALLVDHWNPNHCCPREAPLLARSHLLTRTRHPPLPTEGTPLPGLPRPHSPLGLSAHHVLIVFVPLLEERATCWFRSNLCTNLYSCRFLGVCRCFGGLSFFDFCLSCGNDHLCFASYHRCVAFWPRLHCSWGDTIPSVRRDMLCN